MKKTIILIFFLIITLTGYGQPVVDFLLKARAASEMGNPDYAIGLLNKGIAEFKDSRLYIERAEAKTQKGDYSGAIADYNEANTLTQSSGEYGLAKIYAIKGDAKTSIYHIEMDMNSPFKKREKEIMLDPAFASIDTRAEWRQFWQKNWYSDIEKGISEIEYYIAIRKYDEAISILTELKQNYSGNDELLYGEALINYSNGRNSEAVNKLTVLLDAKPDNERYLRLLAKAHNAASNPSGASLTYSRLLDSGTADAELFILRAGCYMKTGENEKAFSDIEKYLTYYPVDESALRLAGKAKSASGDNINALKYFSENLKLHPNDSECYIDRANCYFISKSWDWAIQDYSMSLDLDPGNSDVWFNKGISLLNLSKVDDACHDFIQSFSMGNKKSSEFISKHCIK